MNTSNVRSNLKKFNLINQISVSFQSKLTSQSKSNSCCNVIWYKEILQLQGSVLRKYGAAMLGVTAQAMTEEPLACTSRKIINTATPKLVGAAISDLCIWSMTHRSMTHSSRQAHKSRTPSGIRSHDTLR